MPYCGTDVNKVSSRSRQDKEFPARPGRRTPRRMSNPKRHTPLCRLHTGPSKIGGRVTLRPSRLLDGGGVDNRVVDLSLPTLASTAWRQAVEASVGRDMRDSRLACEDGELAAEPRRCLDRELRFNGARVVIFASEILPNTSESSPGILTQDPYINSTSRV